MITATYSPEIFNVGSLAQAREVILTNEEDLTTDQRWERETPHLIDLMACLELTPNSVVLDYGCGIGRLAKGLIERYGCRVIGADISPNMRAFAANHVASERFAAVPAEMVGMLGVKFDAAIAVWVLQHCFDPRHDIGVIRSSLKPGGQLFVVNEIVRIVPTREVLWVNDGQDVAEMLCVQMKLEENGRLDPSVVGRPLSERTYWARYAIK